MEHLVVTMLTADEDQLNTPAWTMSYKIVSGDDQQMFSVSSKPNKQGAIIRTVKPLDFEKRHEHLLLVTVDNDNPFSTPLRIYTASVTVRVKDENEAPVFRPGERIISKPEDLPAGTELVTYSATDPDTERKQTVKYKIGSDPAGWLLIDSQTGLITVRSSMDRESDFVQDGKYTALILAVDDDDDIPATGTGTLHS
ncbi:B-cadherin-like [Alosa alosa]|uniref:B-cadherin-like n=1 Tax=Alosa alosa TaxID=278164 RepID=UPI002015297A|nr:B-cadherin-like [Alosa alosa]